jgi:aquaporin Z
MIKYFTEFIGTFIFLTIILNTFKNPQITTFIIVFGLLVAVLFGCDIYGGHYNPAVSLLMFLNGKLHQTDLIPYISSQLLAAIAAKYFYNIINK